MGVYIKNWSLADWKELLKLAKIGANNAMIGEFTEVEEVSPHGDLIDRDALKAAICSRLCIKSEKYLSPEEATIMNEIFAAPTIIPAEEGET